MPASVPALSNAAKLGPVHLRVTDIDRSARVWADVAGFEAVAKGDDRLDLRAGGRTLVTLHGGARFPTRWQSEGLFHVAFALPSRLELARAARRLQKGGLGHAGQDHLISESVYFADPDGIGVELFFPTPDRATVDVVDGEPIFRTRDGASYSGVLPLDMRRLLREADTHGESDGALPAETAVGHVHMRSNAPEAALAFYTGTIGFTPHIASAAFGMFDCGTPEDRHLVAFNTWSGRMLSAASQSSAGLAAFTVELPASDLNAVRRRLAGSSNDAGSGTLALDDPDGTRVYLCSS